MKENELDLFKKHNVILLKAHANIPHLFQPIDLTVTVCFKNYMKNKFSDGTIKQFLNNLKKV